MLATQVPGYDGIAIDRGMEGHTLYYGYIARNIEVVDDGIYLTTIGRGININFGPWTALANRLCSDSM